MTKRPSILIISYIAPYPATDGGKVSIFGTVNYLRKHFDVTLVFRIDNLTEKEGTKKLTTLWPDVKICAFYNYREPGLMKKIKAPFKKIYGPIKTSIKNAFRKQKPNPRSYARFQAIDIIDQPFLSFVESVLKKDNYDIIQVEYIGLISLINILPKKARSIFVQIENRHLLLRDMLATENINGLFANYIVENARFQEQSYMKRYDHVFALNRNDQAIMKNEMGLDNVFVSSYPILDSLTRKENNDKMFKASKLIFIGSQSHYPNEDGVKWFVENIYDEVKRQTGLELYVTGYWQKEFTKKYPGIRFTGFVEDLSDLLKDSIVISPIRIGGGGVRAKIILAMAMRSPVIATTLSSEGLEELANGKNILVADSKEEFISAIGRLSNDPGLAGQLIDNAGQLIERHYSEQAVGERRRKFYNEILQSS